MKKILFVLLVTFSARTFAQDVPYLVDKETLMAMSKAKSLLDVSSATYSPPQAFDIYQGLANKAYPEAMNALGVMYSTGLGVQLNMQTAVTWFNKAALAGYGRAWYNLAMLYKNGDGVTQSDAQAFKCFTKGTALNNGMCWYGKGYMLYKGLGCKQDYTEAYKCFEKGVKRRDEASMYMLGLCFRNGYGVTANTDSARLWLTKAAQRKDKRAIEELADVNKENADLKDVPNLQAPPTATTQVNLKTGFKKVSHRVNKNDIAGEYTGYIIKFDWSGKHIIGQAGLKLNLKRIDSKLTGQWAEEGLPPVTLDGTLTDTALVFNNTAGVLADHYNKENPLPVEFKNSKLNLIKLQDTVYLSGNITLYSPKSHETEKPQFIMLVRTNDKTTRFADVVETSKTDSVHFVAYPNPFSSDLKLRFTLKKPAMVSITVSSLLYGTMVYRSDPQMMSEGDHTCPINFNGPPANYVITLTYGKQLKSAIVFKQ